MDKIIIHNQQEMDAVPVDYDGEIIIRGQNIVVRGNARAYLYNNASAVLYNNASAVLYNNASAVLYNNASAYLHDNASAVLYNNASAVLYNNASAYLHDNASAYLCDNASAELYDNASAVLHGNASAVLYGNASAELYDNASAVLYGNVQVLDKSDGHNITLHGNSRIIYSPRNIDEYLDYFGVKHTKDMATLYKAVRKTNDGKYVSDYDRNFEYIIGECKAEECDTDITQTCSRGIHIAPLYWALQYGKEWDDLAILEVETNIDDIILPENTDGKVRTSKIKVIREIPLEECGILGKMMVRKQRRLS